MNFTEEAIKLDQHLSKFLTTKDVIVIAAALQSAYERGEQSGREKERERCAEYSKTWLEDWGIELQGTSDAYREAIKTGKFNDRRISETPARVYANEYKQRSDAVYLCGELLAKDLRNQP